MKTPTISQKDIQEKWYLIDAAGLRIGKLASIVAELLLGKNDPLIRSNLEPKTHVIVINSSKIDYTAKRGFSKFYKRFSGYPGGQTVEDLDTRFKKNPNFVIEQAVKGMLPKNTRGRNIFTNLRVFTTQEHPHEAQMPTVINVNEFKL